MVIIRGFSKLQVFLKKYSQSQSSTIRGLFVSRQKNAHILSIALAHFIDARQADSTIELNATYSHDERDPNSN